MVLGTGETDDKVLNNSRKNKFKKEKNQESLGPGTGELSWGPDLSDQPHLTHPWLHTQGGVAWLLKIHNGYKYKYKYKYKYIPGSIHREELPGCEKYTLDTNTNTNTSPIQIQIHPWLHT